MRRQLRPKQSLCHSSPQEHWIRPSRYFSWPEALPALDIARSAAVLRSYWENKKYWRSQRTLRFPLPCLRASANRVGPSRNPHLHARDLHISPDCESKNLTEYPGDRAGRLAFLQVGTKAISPSEYSLQPSRPAMNLSVDILWWTKRWLLMRVLLDSIFSKSFQSKNKIALFLLYWYER